MNDARRKILRYALMLASVAAVLAILYLLADGKISYGAASVATAFLALLPFFVVFENRKGMRKIVPIAVMSAIAACSRAAFYYTPQFKPILAVIIITGVVFGCEAGFLTGALSLLCSNFLFGQGLHTPFQMLAGGIIGITSGAFGKTRLGKSAVFLCVFGLLSGFIYGIIVDLQLVFIGFSSNGISIYAALSVYALALPFNAILSASTVICIAILYKPLFKNLSRAKEKYGI